LRFAFGEVTFGQFRAAKPLGEKRAVRQRVARAALRSASAFSIEIAICIA